MEAHITYLSGCGKENYVKVPSTESDTILVSIYSLFKYYSKLKQVKYKVLQYLSLSLI